MRKALEDLRRSYQAKYSGLLAKRLTLMEQSTASRSVFEAALKSVPSDASAALQSTASPSSARGSSPAARTKSSPVPAD
eukprot:SAG11_NODE_1623_length_4559_cov_2.141480_10_plen_79_part_00